MASAEFPECPPGWTHVKVRDVVTKIPTTGKKLKQKDYGDDGLYPVVDQGQTYIAGYSDRNDCLIDVDQPVIVFGDHTRTVKLIDKSFIPGADGIKVLQPLQAVSPHFLKQMLFFLTIDLIDKGYARHYQHLEKTSFYLPPFAEQSRIVAKIDELLSELDNGAESLKAARAQLKTYRQSLLKAAFEGRLTEQWRRDHAGEIETADKFLQRIRAAREADDEAQLKDWKEEAAKPNQDRSRKPKSSLSSRYESGLNEYTPDTEGQASLPASWSWVRLGWVLARKPQNGRSVKSKAGGFPVLTLTALHGNALDMSKCKEGDWGIDDARPYIVNEGDFLIARGNGSKSLVGRGARAVRVEKQVAYPDTMIRVSPDERWMQTRFLSLLWESRVVRDQIESSARTTAGIYKINQQHIKDLLVPLPHNIEEQEYIADSLEAALSACDYTEELIERGLERAEKLRQSILKRAFEGKLVPQDPDDEPASVLLERIRAEQEKEPKSGKGRRKANA